MPEVSVIMPVYNGQAFLRPAVESVLKQTYTSFEFIIVDDGSTDNTPAILDTFRDERIMRLRNRHNLSRPVARNLGLRFAEGKYIALMDADDISLPDRITKQLAYLDSHPEVGVVGTQAINIDSAGKTLEFLNWQYPVSHSLICWGLATGAGFLPPTALFHRDVFDLLGGYSADYPVASDIHFMLRTVSVTRLANLPDVYYFYRFHPESVRGSRYEEQRRLANQARAEFASQLIGTRTETEVLRWVYRPALRRGHTALNREQAFCATAFILDLFRAFMKHGVFPEDELDIVRRGVSEHIRLVRAARRESLSVNT